MTSEASAADDKRFTCTICIGIYKTPRYLPTCGHTFCEDCLLTFTRNTQQCQGSKFHCPICRKSNNLPEHDEVSLQWVQTFPLNSVMVKMMAESLPQSSEEVKEEIKTCDPCAEIGETIPGFKFCFDCMAVLCKNCTKRHQYLKGSKDHKLVDVSEMPVETGSADFLADVEKCAAHPERDVEIYCKSHDAVICLHCSTFQHTGCDMVEISSHGIDVPKLQKDTEALLANMKAAVEHCDCIQALRMDIKSKFHQKLKEIRDSIKQVRDQVVELMDGVMAHVTNVAKQMELEWEDKIDAEMVQVAEVKEINQHNIALLDTVEQHGSERQKFVSAHRMRKRFIETKKQMSEDDKKVKQINAELVMGDELQKLIGSTEVEKLAQITVTERVINHRPLASVSALSVDIGVDSDALRDSKLVKAEEHTVSSGTGREPWYYGVAVCRDGRVILSDYNPGGYLHLYNPADRTQQTLKLPHRPWCAVQMDDSHLAVSSGWYKTISIVTVGNEMRIEKNFNTQNRPRTIVALNTGLLAVSWSDPPAFSVIDITGPEIVQRSYMDQDSTGRKFNSLEYLAVDERRQHVIQPCYSDKAVYCFDLSGKPVFKYTHPELTNPRGVALDRCGNIYVCEHNNNSIHKLSPTGDPISVITEGVPSWPKAICSDVTGTGFWMTRYASPYDQVVYFRLEM